MKRYHTVLDFLDVVVDTKFCKNEFVTTIKPKLSVIKSKHLMIKGNRFYALYDQGSQMWVTDWFRAIDIMDALIYDVIDTLEQPPLNPIILTFRDADSGQVAKFKKLCEKDMADNYVQLDTTLIFADTKPDRANYSTKHLPYALVDQPTPAYDKLTSVLYEPEERHKYEWLAGAVLANDISHVQKFVVFYGDAGTGKSTILNILQMIFDGYWIPFNAKELAGKNNSFALGDFKDSPLVAIQHDGDLSQIADNTQLNSIVSHETMIVNEKFKSPYPMKFNTALFMGSNSVVQITDTKSGLLRRLLDVVPTGDKIPSAEYNILMSQIEYEIGGIAKKCKDFYLANKRLYDGYRPNRMMSQSNDIYDFLEEKLMEYDKNDMVLAKDAWEDYKSFCESSNIKVKVKYRVFREELKAYFESYDDDIIDRESNKHYRKVYKHIKTKLFDYRFVESLDDTNNPESQTSWLQFKDIPSLFETYAANFPAQYAKADGAPRKAWANVSTHLNDLDTKKLHYVKVPVTHIIIDFDIPTPGTKTKDLALNMEAACKLPPTYAELSRSGGGIHLHYNYVGDPLALSAIIDEHIEIKVYTGGQALRRMKTLCNDIPIATLSSGLPLREVRKSVNRQVINNERQMRAYIERALRKESHPGTKPCIDWIYEIFDQAYNRGIPYDLTQMRKDIETFAALSTNNKEYCQSKVKLMKFKSADDFETIVQNGKVAFFDIEQFPNLLFVSYKEEGEDKPFIDLYNPGRKELDAMLLYNLIGFNNRRYDNHIIYARCEGFGIDDCYNLSGRIISGDKNALLPGAYGLSYTDIYDFASAGNKKSLKKLEIEMGIHHQELGLPWNEEVPEELWPLVADYCHNDVIATEKAFNYLSADWNARKILADLSKLTYNDTTNQHTIKIVFQGNKNPQNEFLYRDLSKPVDYLPDEVIDFLQESCPEMMAKKHGEKKSLLPYFPGYKYECGKSTYRGFEAGEGGFVYAETGFHGNVALLDVASMHPHSIISECLFGPRYTKRFKDIVQGRITIKHEDWLHIDDILDGELTKYVGEIESGNVTSKDLANALKTAINSVYGLTDAGFMNPFRDPRNIDNIVAKRGALFMIDLMFEVQARGFTVAHIKTDSIKIPDATPEIIKFVMDFGKRYGYSFEHEATYEKMVLVNNAVYIAKYASKEACMQMYGYLPEKNEKHPEEWTATGTQFKVPYVFKTLFSGEEIIFADVCETKSVKTDISLDFNESLGEDEHSYRFVGKVGSFCPVKAGEGGGLMMRSTPGCKKPYAYVTGTKGYRWKESESVQEHGGIDIVDKSYYQALVDDAVRSINKYCDPDWFRFGQYVDKSSAEGFVWPFETDDI